MQYGHQHGTFARIEQQAIKDLKMTRVNQFKQNDQRSKQNDQR